MPRTKKAAGTAVDQRNGRRVELSAPSPLARFALPVKGAHVRTRRVWAALWDDPVCSLLSPVDREIVVRWIDGTDRWIRALEKADDLPVVTGSMGQDVPSPWFSIAKQHLDVVEKCEAQIGVGALNRARLGLTFAASVKTMAEVNARYLPGRSDDDDEPDPRIIQGHVEPA